MSLLGKKSLVPLATLLVPLVVLGIFFLATTDVALAQYEDTPNQPSALEEFVFTFVVSAFGTLVGAAGSMLDNSIEYFILDFATLYRTSFGGAIELSWAVIRDLMNFALIFGLVYVGFRFILNADEAGAKRNLVTLILAALLVNFSLFFAKFIVDVSNIAGESFARAISSGDTLGISSSFAEVLGLTTSFNPVDAIMTVATNPNASYWPIIIMTMMTLLVAAFVFAAAAILIMIRFIVLAFMLVFSPIVVLGWIFPFFQGISRKWLNTFLGQAFMAPAMFLMLYCSFLILNGIGGEVAAGDTIADGGAFTGSLSAVPFYILGMGFLIGSLIVAQKMGAAGASTAIAVGQAGRRKAGQLAKGGVRNIGRGAAATGAVGIQQTRGRAAYRTLNSDKFKNKLASMKTDEERIRAYQKQKAKAESSYDVRNIGKYIKDKSVIKTQNKGFNQKAKDREKLLSEVYEAMGTVDAVKDTTASAETKQAFDRVSAKQHEYQQAQQDLESALKPRRERIAQLTRALDTATADEKESIRKELEDQRKAIADSKESSSVPKIQNELETVKKQYAESLKRDDARAERDLTAKKYRRQIESIANSMNTFGRRTLNGQINLEGFANEIVRPYSTEDARNLTEKMLKEYGRDGSEKEKKKKRKDDLDILATTLKEEGGLGDNTNNSNEGNS